MGNIVITGATSGIGAVAATTLRARNHRVIAGARGAVPSGVEVRPLELGDLAQVRAFAASIDGTIDGLALNAGVQRGDVDARTVDGFEQTFAINHLAHYLLARLLLPKVADGGRIVFTSSGTHDPAEKTPIPVPRHADARRLADPSTDPERDAKPRVAGGRAYSASKLCNLMTARTLAASHEARDRRIAVHAYDPGFIPATGLGRASPWPIRAILLPVLTRFPIFPGMNRLDDGGAALAGLADGTITGTRVYMALRRGNATWPDPSPLARDDAACAKLWTESAAMVGLPA